MGTDFSTYSVHIATDRKHMNVDIRKIPKAPEHSSLANRLYTNQKRGTPAIPLNVIVIFTLNYIPSMIC